VGPVIAARRVASVGICGLCTPFSLRLLASDESSTATTDQLIYGSNIMRNGISYEDAVNRLAAQSDAIGTPRPG
jgi:hypothetical protein